MSSWLKKEKQKLKKKLEGVTKSEKVQIVKLHLDDVYNKYDGFINLIPDIEKRVQELEGDTTGRKKAWEDVLKTLKNVKTKPKAMKLMYAKKVTSKIKDLRKKFPDE